MAKSAPLEAFEDNISDAERLLSFAGALANERKRKMPAALQERVGDAMNIGKRRRSQLDCVESPEVFIVLKPGGSLRREHFSEPYLRPLLRQSIVAVAAAVRHTSPTRRSATWAMPSRRNDVLHGSTEFRSRSATY